MRRNEMAWRTTVAVLAAFLGRCGIVAGATENELMAVLKSDGALSEKARACEQLAVVGSDRAVAVLAGLLGDEPLGDYARFALEPMPGAKVDTAFRTALGRIEGRLLAGVINSIGVRGDVEAVGVLGAIARDAGSDVRGEAIAALGRIATDDAVRLISGMLNDESAQVRAVTADACLVAADRLVEQGRKRDALKVYDAVSRADVPGHVQAAAVYRAIMTGDMEAVNLLVAQLDRGDPERVAVALRAARQLRGEGVTERLAEQLKLSAPALQVLLIEALADRSDAAAYASVKALTNSDSVAVRLEAVKALGRIGDVTAVPVLASRVGRDADETEAAVAALRQLEAKGVNEAIVGSLITAHGEERSVLIEVLTSRAAKEARPALLAAASSADEDVTIAAFKGLTVLADGEDTPALVGLLVGLKLEAARGHAENAVVAAANRIADENMRADAVLAQMGATRSSDTKVSLVRVLGRIANARAFEAVARGPDAENPTIRDAAIRALAAWPDGRALGELATIAENSANETHRVLALWGYVRLLGVDKSLSRDERVAKYAYAMGLARDSASKTQVLAGLANAKHPDALGIAIKYLDEEPVKEEAMLAVLRIAQATAGARPAAAREAALKVAKGASRASMREEAGTLAETIGTFGDFVVGWQVAGPYARENAGYQTLFKTAIGPEAGEDTTWSVMPAGTDAKRPWVMDLLKLWPGEQQVAYARTWVESERDVEAVLETGSDDGIKVWVNGQLVQSVDAARAAVPASDKAKISLKAGWNKVMVKVTQNVLGWEFCVRIADADGGTFEGITVDCLHEP